MPFVFFFLFFIKKSPDHTWHLIGTFWVLGGWKSCIRRPDVRNTSTLCTPSPVSMDLNFYPDLSDGTGQHVDSEFMDNSSYNGYDSVNKVSNQDLGFDLLLHYVDF